MIKILCLFLFQSALLTFTHAIVHLNVTPTVRTVKKTEIINYRDIEYHLSVHFGSKKQSFDLLIDTGSSDLWVPSVKCDGCKQKKRFNCKDSNSCQLNPRGVLAGEYADGPILGQQAFDDIQFSPGVTLKNQSFIVVFQTSGNVATTNGILGLSFQSLAMNPQPTFLSNLLKSGEISNNVFSIYLESGHQRGSKLILGGSDKRFYMGDLTYTPIISFTSYLIRHNGLKVGDTFIKSNIESALVDSGNSCFTIPRPLIENIRDHLNNKFNIKCDFFVEQYAPDFSMMDCEINEQSKPFPPISIVINNKNFSMSPDDYIYECRRDPVNKTSRCFTKLELAEKIEFIILGMAFHHSFYVTFDLDKRRIGFAKSVAENQIKYIGYPFVELPGTKSFLQRDDVHSSSELVILLAGCLILPLILLLACLIKRRLSTNEDEDQKRLTLAPEHSTFRN